MISLGNLALQYLQPTDKIHKYTSNLKGRISYRPVTTRKYTAISPQTTPAKINHETSIEIITATGSALRIIATWTIARNEQLHHEPLYSEMRHLVLVNRPRYRKRYNRKIWNAPTISPPQENTIIIHNRGQCTKACHSWADIKTTSKNAIKLNPTRSRQAMLVRYFLSRVCV